MPMVSTAHTDSTLPTRMNARRAPRRVRASEAPGGCISRGTRGSVSRMYGRAKPKPRLPSPSGSGPKPAVRSSSLTKMARVSQPPGSSRSARAGGTTIGRGDNDLRTACGGTPLDQECKVSSIYKGAGPAKANTHRHTTRRGANACSRDQGRGRGDSGPIPTAPGHPGTAGDLVEERASRRTKDMKGLQTRDIFPPKATTTSLLYPIYHRVPAPDMWAWWTHGGRSAK